MRRVFIVATMLAVMAFCAASGFAQVPTTGNAMKMVPVKDQVDMELLTWNEIHDKIHNEGKTTVIIVNGGTEQRGPQDVLGGHTIMGNAMKMVPVKDQVDMELLTWNEIHDKIHN